MINNSIKLKMKNRHRQYQKHALLKNIKEVVEYCLYIGNMEVFYEYYSLYVPYCKRWNVSLNKYEFKIKRGIR